MLSIFMLQSVAVIDYVISYWLETLEFGCWKEQALRAKDEVDHSSVMFLSLMTHTGIESATKT